MEERLFLENRGHLQKTLLSRFLRVLFLGEPLTLTSSLQPSGEASASVLCLLLLLNLATACRLQAWASKETYSRTREEVKEVLDLHPESLTNEKSRLPEISPMSLLVTSQKSRLPPAGDICLH